MVTTKYSFQKESASTAKAYGRDLPISTKISINVCKAIRGKPLDKAENLLNDVLAFRRPIAFTRFNDGVGHRRGPFASGRFPLKAVTEILAVLESAKANAANLGLSEDLVLAHICAHKASSPLHQGRQSRRAMKRTHVEIVLEEATPVSKKASAKTRSSKASSAQKQKVSGEVATKVAIAKEQLPKEEATEKTTVAKPSAEKSEVSTK